VAVIRQETGSWRWTLFNLVFLLALSIGAGILVFQLTSALGW
jgi:Fe2+ transport system protein B